MLQQRDSTVKNNNKKNNYINQLLRLPLLKHTHTEKNNTINKKKAVPTSLPKEKAPLQDPRQRFPLAAVKEKGPSTVVAKTSTLEVAGILDPHFYVSAT